MKKGSGALGTSFECPNCHKEFKTYFTRILPAGLYIRCPGCQQEIMLRTEDTVTSGAVALMDQIIQKVAQEITW